MSAVSVALLVDAVEAAGVALAWVPRPGAWAHRGACRGVMNVVFFPGRGGDPRPAKAVCRGCPVVEACREFALEHVDLRGVWGGLTHQEREALAEQRAAAPAVAVVASVPPPAAKAEPGTLYGLLEQLTGHPGRWARVARFTAGHSGAATAALLRSGHRRQPPGRWAFEGRLNDAGGSDLYACFEPAEEATAS